MALDQVMLPKKPKDLTRTINHHVDLAYQRYGWRRVLWRLYHQYLNGDSHFTKLDETTNNVEGSKLDDEGAMHFRTEQLMDNLDKLQARLGNMDWMPAVDRTDKTLGGIRERAASLSLAQAIFSKSSVDAIKDAVSFNLTVCGSCGLQVNAFQHPILGLTAELEVVHPIEVMPFPLSDMDPTKARGRVRRHVVTYDSLVAMMAAHGVSKQSISQKKKDMIIERGTPSETLEPGRMDSAESDVGESVVNNIVKGGPDTGGEDEEHVLVTQVWLFGPQELVTRYIVMSGEAVLLDKDMTATKSFCPLAWARAIETGTFYGAGHCDKVFLLSRKLDEVIGQWVENVDVEQMYGMTLLPASSIDGQLSFERDEKSGFQYSFYSPDGSFDGTPRATHIKPQLNSQGASQVTVYLDSLMQRLGLPEVMQGGAPGRVDSMQGLSFLDEQASVSMDGLSSAIRTLMGHVYKAGVQQAMGFMLDNGSAEVRLGRIDLSLLGLKIDPYTGSLRIGGQGANPIPDLVRVEFTTKSHAPKSIVARKTEALRMVELGLTDRTGIMMLDIKEGLDFAIWSDAERGAVEVVERNIVFMFNDGVNVPTDENGSQSWVTVLDPRSAYPAVQLPVLKAFLQGPEFAAASAEIQEMFYQYHDSLMEMMSVVLPPGWPTVDEAAQMQQLAATAAGNPPPM